MRVLLPTLVALAVLVPAASAQIGYADTALQVGTGDAKPRLADGETVVVPVEIQYSYSRLGFSTSPTPVSLKVAELPSWLVATISPSTVLLEVGSYDAGGGATGHAYAVVDLVLSLNGTLLKDEIGTVKVVAFAHPNGAYRGTSAETALVARGVGGSACEATQAPVAEEDAQPLETQTLGAAPTMSPLSLAAAGAVGAALGLGVARFRNRR